MPRNFDKQIRSRSRFSYRGWQTFRIHVLGLRRFFRCRPARPGPLSDGDPTPAHRIFRRRLGSAAGLGWPAAPHTARRVGPVTSPPPPPLPPSLLTPLGGTAVTTRPPDCPPDGCVPSDSPVPHMPPSRDFFTPERRAAPATSARIARLASRPLPARAAHHSRV